MSTQKAAVSVKPYSVAEEIANSLSHGAGVLFGVIALLLLVFKSVQMDDTLRWSPSASTARRSSPSSWPRRSTMRFRCRAPSLCSS